MATEPAPSPLLASQLFAKAFEKQCAGDLECYWCSAPCRRELIHDDPPPLTPFRRPNKMARRPQSAYMCVGCWLWRRPRTTVNFLAGGLKDRQAAKNHSWLIVDGQPPVALREDDHPHLLPILLKPPTRFFLSLRREADNLLQLCQVNDLPGVTAETPIAFTLDNVPLTYTVYELEEATKFLSDGASPGVRALIDFLGVQPGERRVEDRPDPLHPQNKSQPEEKRGSRGRPKTEERGVKQPGALDKPAYTTQKVLHASGAPTAQAS